MRESTASRKRKAPSLTLPRSTRGGERVWLDAVVARLRIPEMADIIRVGVIGCGAISGADLGLAKNFSVMQIAACADLDMNKAKAAAEKFQVPQACTVEQLLADDSIQIVLN